MKNRLRLFKIKEVAIVSILLLIVLTSVSVGYALYNENLDLTGEVVLNKVGMVEITNVMVSKEDSITNTSYTTSSHFVEGGTNVKFNVLATAVTANYGEIYYKVKFKNNSAYTYTFTGVTYADNASYVAPRLLDMFKGQVLAPGEEKEATVIIFSEEKIPATTNLEYNVTFKFTQGEVDCDATPLEVRNKNGTEFDYNNEPLLVSLKVIDIQDVSMKYYIKTTSTDFAIANSQGKVTKFTNIVATGDSDTNNIYLVPTGTLTKESYNVQIQMIMEDGRTFNCPLIVVNKKSNLLPGITANIKTINKWGTYYAVEIPLTNTGTTNYNNLTYFIKFKKTVANFNYYGNYYYFYDEDNQVFKINNVNRYNDTMNTPLNAGKTIDLLVNEQNANMMVVNVPEGLTPDDIEITYMVDVIEWTGW